MYIYTVAATAARTLLCHRIGYFASFPYFLFFVECLKRSRKVPTGDISRSTNRSWFCHGVTEENEKEKKLELFKKRKIGWRQKKSLKKPSDTPPPASAVGGGMSRGAGNLALDWQNQWCRERFSRWRWCYLIPQLRQSCLDLPVVSLKFFMIVLLFLFLPLFPPATYHRKKFYCYCCRLLSLELPPLLLLQMPRLQRHRKQNHYFYHRVIWLWHFPNCRNRWNGTDGNGTEFISFFSWFATSLLIICTCWELLTMMMVRSKKR